MAPFTPFLTEYMYQELQKLLPEDQQQESVHLTSFPEANQFPHEKEVERQMERMQTVVNMIRKLRSQQNIPVKIPFKNIIVAHRDEEYRQDIDFLKDYINVALLRKTWFLGRL